MDTNAAPAKRDAMDHPMYRIAHLHGDRWVTLKPHEQHSPKADMPGGIPEGIVYRCQECEEYVVIAPPS